MLCWKVIGEGFLDDMFVRAATHTLWKNSPKNGIVGGPGGSNGERWAETANWRIFQATQQQNRTNMTVIIVPLATVAVFPQPV